MYARDPQGNLPANNQPASLSVRVPAVAHWIKVAVWIVATGVSLAGWIAICLFVRLLWSLG